MSSIFELFDGGDGEPTFTAAGLEAILDQTIADRPVAGRPIGFDPSQDGGATPPAPPSDGEVQGAEGAGTPPASTPETPPATPPAPLAPVAGDTPPAAPPASAPVPPADPFATMSELERLEILQYRAALADPDRALAVRQAMLGLPQTVGPVAVAPPVAPPAPTLPEEFEPGSAEAQLWQSNVDMQREIAELRQGQQATNQQTEQDQMNGAARRAVNAFTAKYGARLAPDEIQAIAQLAGMQKLPEALRPTVDNWDEAMTKALDFTLRSNDALLGKVLGAPAAPPVDPTVRTPEATQRGRQLTALSSAASPAGDSPTRAPIEHRADGKLSEKSRLQLVQEMVNGGGITGSPE